MLVLMLMLLLDMNVTKYSFQPSTLALTLASMLTLGMNRPLGERNVTNEMPIYEWSIFAPSPPIMRL